MVDNTKYKSKSVKYTLIAIGIALSIGSVYVFTLYQELHKQGLVVLLFHEIIENENEWSNKYQHRLRDFEEQLDYLKQEGYKTILPSEIKQYKDIRHEGEKILILSFDDGTPDHYTMVYPLLRKRNFKGVFFVVANNINTKYGFSESQLVEMSKNNMEIGSHSYSHPFLDELEEEELYFQLHESKKMLTKIIGKQVTSFAPPGGWYNDLIVKKSMDVGYKAFFSCEIGTNDILQPIYVYKRIEVLGYMKLDEFKKLLNPPQILDYKLMQSIKFMIHRLLGSDAYSKIAEAL